MPAFFPFELRGDFTVSGEPDAVAHRIAEALRRQRATRVVLGDRAVQFHVGLPLFSSWADALPPLSRGQVQLVASGTQARVQFTVQISAPLIWLILMIAGAATVADADAKWGRWVVVALVWPMLGMLVGYVTQARFTSFLRRHA